MTEAVARLLIKAASLLDDEGCYARHSTESVFNPKARSFCATGLVERANTCPPIGMKPMLRPGCPNTLGAAKAAVCRMVGYPHIDCWEHDVRPAWHEIKDVFAGAAKRMREAA